MRRLPGLTKNSIFELVTFVSRRRGRVSKARTPLDAGTRTAATRTRGSPARDVARPCRQSAHAVCVFERIGWLWACRSAARALSFWTVSGQSAWAPLITREPCYHCPRST
eukprot:427488-Prymnesium_polylepis.2